MVETGSPEETMGLGRSIGGRLKEGDVVLLIGELGSGKTCFTKGVAQGMGLDDPGIVTSPTFVLMNSYPTRIPLRHYDLYRVEGGELTALGFWDLRDSSVSVIEWGEKVDPGLLGDHLKIRFEITGETARKVDLRACGERIQARELERI
jgi:tRNA threonylcarbamoyladenosine biosynthesis protein TsaE